jgi:WD40 repeat protein
MTQPVEASDASARTTVDRDNPWPGPEAFREADAPYFFGRDHPRAQLSRLLLQNRLVVLYGRSGLGKTSLLRAGVFPVLREASTLPVYLRLVFRASGDAPSVSDLRSQVKTALERAAADAHIDAPSIDEDSTLWEWFFRSEARFFNERSRRVRPVLVFDQFEEAFTLGRTTPDLATVTDQFLEELADLVRGSVPAGVAERFAQDSAAALEFSTDRDPCGVLLAVRQEFLAELLRMRPRLPSLLDQRFELSGMTIAEAEVVVSKPGGHLVEPGVPARIVAFVAAAKRSADDLTTDDTTVDPAILSIFCRELNGKRRDLGMSRITSELVAGAQEAIIADFYKRSTRDLGPEIHRFIEDRLVTDSGYRNSASLDDALRLPGISAPSIDKLIERRLVRQEGIGPRARLELTHDVLTTPIVQSRNLRRLRELEEQARRAAEQERETRAKRDAMRRLMVSLVILSAGLIVVAGLAFTTYTARTALESTLSSAHVQQGLGLIGAGQRDRGYAYVAQALRVDPGNVAARSLALDAILHINWPLPETIATHSGLRGMAQLDPTGARLVTQSEDGMVRVWRVGDGAAVGQPMHHDGDVLAVRFGRSGRTLLTLASDSIARLWDIETGMERARFDRPDSATTAVEFGPDDEVVVTGESNGVVCLWRGGTATVVKAHTDEILALTVDARGERLATSSADRTAAVWDIRTGRLVARLTGHNDGVVSVKFSPADSQHILSAGRDGTARLWDLKTAKAVSTIRPGAAIDSVQFSQDGSRILTVYGEKFAALWDASAAQSIGTTIVHDAPIVSAAFSPEGLRVLTASLDQTVRLWDGFDGSALAEPMRLEAQVAAAVFSPDGQHVATADQTGTSIVWDIRGGAAIPASFRTGCDFRIARYQPDGQGLVVGCNNGELVFRSPSGDQETSRQTLPYPDPSDLSFSMSPSSSGGTPMVVVSGGRALVLRPHQDSPPTTIEDPELGIQTAEISSDGRTVLTTSPSFVARTWDAILGRAIARFPGENVGAHFSPDGRVITTSASEGIVQLRQTDGTPVDPPVRVEKTSYLSAVGNRDGTRLLIQADRVTLWNTETATAVTVIPGAGIRSCDFSPDGSVFYTSGSNTQLWESKTGHLIATLSGLTIDARFTGSGQRLIVRPEVGQFRLWDGRTGDPHTETRFVGYGNSVAETDPSGQHLLVVGNGKVLIWDVPVGEREDAAMIAPVLEAMVGFRVNQRGAVERIEGRDEALRQLRLFRVGTTETFGDRVRAWALGDRGSRTISPSSTMSIDQYIQMQMGSPYSADFTEAQRLFPWHPRLKSGAPASPVNER